MWCWILCVMGESRIWARSRQLSLRTGESVPQETAQPKAVDIRVCDPAVSGTPSGKHQLLDKTKRCKRWDDFGSGSGSYVLQYCCFWAPVALASGSHS